jgi:molybdopterin/thiamine biosynthesis adenylyltransferase/rhodanese-related sulfurtransferase
MTQLLKGELEQYSRHLSLQGFGPQCQDRLKKSSVLVIGAGGLGCPALQYLTAAGVGKIGIMDDDLIEISNLQRQVLFSHPDRGKNKAQIAASRLSTLNPYIEITAYPERLSVNNCASMFKQYDLVVDGTDNFNSKYLINDGSVLFKKPLVHGSIHEFEGMVSVFNLHHQGPTYRCLFPEQPDSSSMPTCAEAGVLGVLPGIIGSWQALEAIKVLSGIGEPLSGRVLLYNALNQSVHLVNLDTVPENLQITKLPSPINSCTAQKGSGEIIEISSEDFMKMMEDEPSLQTLDVREDWERQIARIEPSIHLPLANLTNEQDMSPDLFDPSQKLVIFCKAGVRSRMACQFLQHKGFSQLYNLTDGMDGWMTSYPDHTVMTVE